MNEYGVYNEFNELVKVVKLTRAAALSYRKKLRPRNYLVFHRPLGGAIHVNGCITNRR